MPNSAVCIYRPHFSKRWRSTINLSSNAIEFRFNTSTDVCTVRTQCSIETSQSDGLSSCRNCGQMGQSHPWQSISWSDIQEMQGKYGNRKVLCLATLYLGTTQLRNATGKEGSGPCLTPSAPGLVPHASRHSHKITRIPRSSQFPKFYIHFNPSLSTLPVRPSKCTAQISARHNTNFKTQKADVVQFQSVWGGRWSLDKLKMVDKSQLGYSKSQVFVWLQT